MFSRIVSFILILAVFTNALLSVHAHCLVCISQELNVCQDDGESVSPQNFAENDIVEDVKFEKVLAPLFDEINGDHCKCGHSCDSLGIKRASNRGTFLPHPHCHRHCICPSINAAPEKDASNLLSETLLGAILPLLFFLPQSSEEVCFAVRRRLLGRERIPWGTCRLHLFLTRFLL